MKTKYRIVKTVTYYPEYGDDKPKVYYRIQDRFLFLWSFMTEILGSKYNMFDTVEEAEKALLKHHELQKLFDSDGKVEKVFKL